LARVSTELKKFESQLEFRNCRPFGGADVALRLPTFERNHVVKISVALELAEHLLSDSEMERTNAAERPVALGWNP
jgi:hypothetical protein